MLVSGWVFFGAGLCFLFAVTVRLGAKSVSNTRLSWLLCALGLVQLNLWYWVAHTTIATATTDTNTTIEWPFIYYAHLPALYCIGPLVYRWAQSLFQLDSSSDSFPHFLPAYLISFYAAGAYLFLEPISLDALPSVYYSLCILVGCGYLWRVLQQVSPHVTTESSYQVERGWLLVVFGSGVLAGLFVLIASLWQSLWFYQWYGSAITLLLVVSFVIYIRFPGISDDVVGEIVEHMKQEKYAQSMLDYVDVAAKMAVLNSMMKEHNRYRDEQLDLATLADEIDLTPHQLSELLNGQIGQSFPRFINQYRIEEAKRLLTADRKRPVLDIAMAVGFNSTSSFYTAFKSFEGVTPGQYRKSTAV